MDTASQTEVPQPSKESAYTQTSNPVSQTPQEQRGNLSKPQQPDSSLLYATSGIGSSLRSHEYGEPPEKLIRRTAESKPSSDAKLAQLVRERSQKMDSEGSRGHIDLEYGIEQQPSEGNIAHAVEDDHAETAPHQRVQPGVHAGAVGTSTPGFEQDTAAQMDRKRAEHDQKLGLGRDAGAKSPPDLDTAAPSRAGGGDGLDQKEKARTDRGLDVQGAVRDATGNTVV